MKVLLKKSCLLATRKAFLFQAKKLSVELNQAISRRVLVRFDTLTVKMFFFKYMKNVHYNIDFIERVLTLRDFFSSEKVVGEKRRNLEHLTKLLTNVIL